MYKHTIVSGFLLTILLLNTGCISNLFIKEEKSPPNPKVKKRKVKVIEKNRKDTTIKKRTIKNIVVTDNSLKKYENPNTECNDDLTIKKSKCNRGVIEDIPEARAREGEVHSLTSIRGKKIHIKEMSNGFLFPEYKNKIIILEMFGKDCPHCLRELPIIDRIRRRYRGILEVIAIQAQDRMDKFTAKNYINGHQIRYPIIEGDDAMNLQSFIQKTYGWQGILPYILIIKDGVTEFSYSGEVEYSQLEKDINSLL